jgi:hypothetical protein
MTERLRKLPGVGGDCVACGHGEIGRELVEWKPAYLAGFARFAILGAATGYAAQVGGGDPVLAFEREEMIGDAKKTFDGDFDTDFFGGFAEGAVVKSFEVFELAPYDAPAAGFRRKLAKGEERAAAMVEDEDTNANPRNGACSEIVLRWHGLW